MASDPNLLSNKGRKSQLPLNAKHAAPRFPRGYVGPERLLPPT